MQSEDVSHYSNVWGECILNWRYSARCEVSCSLMPHCSYIKRYAFIMRRVVNGSILGFWKKNISFFSINSNLQGKRRDYDEDDEIFFLFFAFLMTWGEMQYFFLFIYFYSSKCKLLDCRWRWWHDRDIQRNIKLWIYIKDEKGYEVKNCNVHLPRVLM